MKAPSPALVVASLALAVSLGGTSYAVLKIDGHTIKDHSVPASKLTNAAQNSLRGNRGPQGLPGARGAVGPQGTPGAMGLQGIAGANGSPGLSNVHIVQVDNATTALCNPGEHVFGGGASSNTPGVTLTRSFPLYPGNNGSSAIEGWTSIFSGAATTQVYAVCATTATT